MKLDSKNNSPQINVDEEELSHTFEERQELLQKRNQERMYKDALHNVLFNEN